MKNPLLLDFISGGWVISLLGAIGMLIRYISGSITHLNWTDTILKFLSAVTFTTFVWMLIESNTDIYSWIKAILYGLSGLIGPELIQGLVFIGKKFANSPIQTIKDLKNND